MKQQITTLMILLVLCSMLLIVKTVEGQTDALKTIYILSDGSISPATPLIVRTGDLYSLSGNINATIIVQKGGIIFNGNGYTLYGNNTPYGAAAVSGFFISGVNNVTIMNTRIINYSYGVLLQNTMYDNITNNYFDYNSYAVRLYGNADFNTIANNTMTRGLYGIGADYSFNNNITVIYNNITDLGSGVGIILLNSAGNIIKGNTMDHNNKGVNLYNCTNSVVSGNIMTYMDQAGIHLIESDLNTITGNKINRTRYAAGIAVSTSSENSVSGNDLWYNEEGIRIEKYSTLNMVFGNNLVYNDYGVRLYNHADNNTFYHNNFNSIDYQVFFLSDDNLYNNWNSSYPSGGNYWSSYTGADIYSGINQNETGNDGIGDSVYNIGQDNTDYYPLMGSYSNFSINYQEETYYIATSCNSTISYFQFDEDAKSVSFNVTGDNGTEGFCRVIIPKAIIENLWQGNYTVLLNGEPWPFRNWTDATNTYIYLNYTHSEHQITIIPEFPSGIIMPLLMVLSIVAVVLAKKKRRKEKLAFQNPFF